MPNLTTALPRRTGDLQKDYDNLYDTCVSLIDELKSILCNLDSGNVTEAASIKAQNIDVSQAKIKDAQVQSMTADKLTAGTIDVSEGISVQGQIGNYRLSLEDTAIVFWEKVNGSWVKRIGLGFTDDDSAVFFMRALTGDESLEMVNDSIVLTGKLATGREGQPRTEIFEDGIKGYDNQGRRSGLWCNTTNDMNVKFADLILYKEGREMFKVYDSIDGMSISCYGHTILNASSSGAFPQGSWAFSQGTSGGFTTADNKAVTVTNGIITNIT